MSTGGKGHGVTRILAGVNVTVTPTHGTGDVTVSGIASSGESVLGADFVLTGASGVYQDTGLSISLPNIGTYLVYGNVRSKIKPAAAEVDFIVSKLRNTTDAVDITNSERFGAISAELAEELGVTAALTIRFAIAAAPKTIALFAQRTFTTAPTISTIGSDVNGRTNLGFIQVA